MTQVLVSTKYQVVIPRDVREELHIRSGQKMSCMVKGGIVYLIPYKPLSALKGMLKANKFNLKDVREKKDRMI